jgi:poly(3-hydroxybutyrate) depolymerase
VGDVVPDVADELRRLEDGVAGLVEAAKTGKAYVPGRAALFGDSHRTTVDGRAYRLYVPSEAAGDPSGPMPLVVALHGAGGNEDMYFEAYGAGEALALAKARGWVLAAPDVASDAVAVAQDVRSLLDIDAKRVYLTGHSMGAVAAWSAAAARPDLWAAVAPVSGGGLSIPRAAEGLPPPPPVLVVAGEIDFGRGMAEATAKRAKDSGLAVEVRVLPDLDHLLVVAASLPGVFAWFEAHPKP